MDAIYHNEINQDVKPASEGEFSPLEIGPLKIWPPVVLAPMAGVTNYPFRALCKEFGAGLFVSEMITARPLVEGNEKTLKLSDFGPDESPRSLQLYGVDPEYCARAAEKLVSEGRVDHIDMNFGCPVRKVTSKGGGSALPLKPRLLQRIVGAVVKAAGDVPVTIKVRLGIDDQYLTFHDAGDIAESEGCAAIGLHARTAEELYDGEARWKFIAELKERVSIPVLGNGDIWEAQDALRMMRQTGCDGVIVGRGCLGRPWLFGDLAEVFNGHEPSNPPNLGRIAEIMLDHAARLVAWFGERRGILMMRRFNTWYTKGFPGSAALRAKLVKINSFAEMQAILGDLPKEQVFPPAAMRAKRCKSGGKQKVALPEGYLSQLDDDQAPGPEAEDGGSGG